MNLCKAHHQIFFLLLNTLDYGLYNLIYNISMNLNPWYMSNEINTYIVIYRTPINANMIFEKISAISRGIDQSIIFTPGHFSNDLDLNNEFLTSVSMIL
ncbi:unnamed protein product [Rotaria sp. Silwood1]|nr:unnamed protein product [Rotaria sp. Silwood1]